MPVVAVTAFITWAHRNAGWSDERATSWARTVRGFAELLISNGIDADLDLFHENDPAVVWSQFGPKAIQDADVVLIVVSSAWRERWEGTNDPTTGAGAVGEANTLRGLFERNQKVFKQRTHIVVLPGATDNDIPPELSVLNRFPLKTVDNTDAGLEDLLRTLTGQPRYLRPTLGEPRRFDPEPPVAVAGASTRSRSAWLAAFMTASESRTRQRQSGAGLSSDQLDAVERFRPSVPADLRSVPRGSLRILIGELGSGKSEIAEQWLRERVESGAANDGCALPLWVSVEDLDAPLESIILSRADQSTLTSVGIDLVVDGLDQRADRARDTIRQASDVLARWPKVTIVITSRPLSKIDPALPMAVPELTDYESTALMSAVAGQPLPEFDDALKQSSRRPLFALLIAQHASDAAGVTGIAELMDLVIDDVVHDASQDLYPLLRRLAAETLRSGGPIDPARFCDAPDAAAVRDSHLVTRTGRRCGFSLATFEHWFGARAILEGDVDLPALLTSLTAFDRWKYALSMILAAGEPVRADAVMAAVMRWNPGAAGWLIGDMGRGGLSRRRPTDDATTWEVAGARLREATSAALDGLGPLATTFGILAATPSGTLTDLTLAIDIDGGQLTFGWTTKRGFTGRELPDVVRIQEVVHLNDRPWGYRGLRLPPAQNWPWVIVRDTIAKDIASGLVATTNQIIASSDSAIGRAEFDAARAGAFEQGMYPGLHESLTYPAIYPSPDLPPSGSTTEPWARFTVERMRQRAEAIVQATMRLYLELTELLTPAFGDTLAHRGLMPVEFFGTISYNPDAPREHFALPGPTEPGVRWLLRPIGDANRVRPSADQNRVSLTANDAQRANQIADDRAELYAAFRAYVEANPAYQDFAASFSTHAGGLGVFQPRPATKHALNWLAADLKQLGWFDGSMPTSL